MAMEDNSEKWENDNDFRDSKSDRRPTGRTSVVGYVIKNIREDEQMAWARLDMLFNTSINVIDFRWINDQDRHTLRADSTNAG
jgi:hypothetical protein